MSVFASAGQKTKNKVEHEIERVKGALEHLSLYVGLAIYIALGAKVFQIIEQGAELERMSTQKALLIMERRTFLERLVNTSRSHPLNKERFDLLLRTYEEAAERAAANGLDIVSQNYEENWDYLQAVFFSTTILTTIGYGNIAPQTFPGRMFCLLFGIIGIPFTLSVIADVGGIFANLLTQFWKAHGEKFGKFAKKFKRKSHIDEEDTEDEDEDEEVDLFNNNFLTAFLSLLFLFIFLSFGAGLFTLYEDWTFLDAFYFWDGRSL